MKLKSKQVIPEEEQQLVEEKEIIKGKFFVNHSFTGFEN